MLKFCKKCNGETERKPSGACRPCHNLSVAKYYAANRERVKAKNDAWHAANRDKVRAARSAKYAANGDKVRAASLAWYAANRERANARNAAWRAANRELVKAKNAAWRVANRERHTKNSAAWRAANPEKRRIQQQNRESRKRANGGKLSPDLASKLFILQKGKCPCCNKPLGDDFHLDHIIPIKLGGSNTDDNIQLLRQRCNQQKQAKHPVEFMQSRGFLL